MPLLKINAFELSQQCLLLVTESAPQNELDSGHEAGAG